MILLSHRTTPSAGGAPAGAESLRNPALHWLGPYFESVGLQGDPAAASLGERLDELRAHREAIAHAAQEALAGPLSASQRQAVERTLQRIEAALRARAVMNA